MVAAMTGKAKHELNGRTSVMPPLVSPTRLWTATHQPMVKRRATQPILAISASRVNRANAAAVTVMAASAANAAMLQTVKTATWRAPKAPRQRLIICRLHSKVCYKTSLQSNQYGRKQLLN